MTHDRHLRVFLCHGSEDKPTIRDIYSRLREDGVNPWLDDENLLPGQDWDSEIRQAVRRSDAILVCLSSHSVRKEGYLQKELKFALDVAEEKPEGTIFIIPVKLDSCQLPQRLRSWQWVEWSQPNAYERILSSLRARADESGIEHLPGQGPLIKITHPVDNSSGRILYKAADVQELIQKRYDSQVGADDVPVLSSEQVVAITNEALSELLSRYHSDERRATEKEKVLALMGVRYPYREWQEATTKNHCFRNETDTREINDTMERHSVKSSNISFVAYDRQSKMLEVTFYSGSIYRYFNVPENLFQGLLRASSHGKYLDTYIKKPGYAYEQIR